MIVFGPMPVRGAEAPLPNTSLASEPVDRGIGLDVVGGALAAWRAAIARHERRVLGRLL